MNDLATLVHGIAKDKGFYDGDFNLGQKLMLVTSELGEALEADRKDRYADRPAYTEKVKEMINRVIGRQGVTSEDDVEFRNAAFEEHIKDSVEDEIVDALIRLLDLAAYLKMDVEFHVAEKVRYNSTRGHKHGKKY